jgi:hypothetical protein
MGIFFVIMGVLAIAVAIFGKKFTVADVLSLSGYRQKSSTWSGRLVFAVGGISFVALGVKLLMGK